MKIKKEERDFLDLKRIPVFYNKRNKQYSITLPKRQLGRKVYIPKFIDLKIKFKGGKK